MMIKVTPTVRANPSLLDWINDIETDYMEKYGDFGASMAHLVLEGPWNFALLFPGSDESVAYLSSQILSKAGDTEILTMAATDLDELRGGLQTA
jgi:hypothetical protein